MLTGGANLAVGAGIRVVEVLPPDSSWMSFCEFAGGWLCSLHGPFIFESCCSVSFFIENFSKELFRKEMDLGYLMDVHASLCHLQLIIMC